MPQHGSLSRAGDGRNHAAEEGATGYAFRIYTHTHIYIRIIHHDSGRGGGASLRSKVAAHAYLVAKVLPTSAYATKLS